MLTNRVRNMALIGCLALAATASALTTASASPAPASGWCDDRNTPDRKIGYTVTTSGTPGNKRSEFWVIDIPSGRVVRTQEFDGRARYTFGMSSTGKELYIYGAGYDIEVYDPMTLKLRSTIDLNADQTTGMIVVPGK